MYMIVFVSQLRYRTVRGSLIRARLIITRPSRIRFTKQRGSYVTIGCQSGIISATELRDLIGGETWNWHDSLESLNHYIPETLFWEGLYRRLPPAILVIRSWTSLKKRRVFCYSHFFYCTESNHKKKEWSHLFRSFKQKCILFSLFLNVDRIVFFVY